jgi:hypothetical protein
MPMDPAKRMLGYGDDESSEMFQLFCESHGITCDKTTQNIIINRRNVREPEAPIVSREYHLIEVKLKVSVSPILYLCLRHYI